MKRRTPLFAMAALPLAGYALAAAPSDASAMQDEPFKYSSIAPVTVPAGQSVVQMKLPREVYLNAQSEQLHDLRLFDAEGRKVPFSLINPADQLRTRRTTLPARVFAVFDRRNQPAALPAELEIKTSRDGSVLSVMTKAQAANPSPRRISSLIIDMPSPTAGPGRQLVGALDFKLPAHMKSYSAKVALEVSDDLKSWDTLAESSLDWLVNDVTSDTLANSRIQFSPAAFRYARLTWLEGAPIEFAQVDAQFEGQGTTPYGPDTLVVQPEAGHFPNDLVYPSAIAIPVEKLGLQFKQQNVVFPVVLGQYIDAPNRGIEGNPTKQFVPRLRFTFFQLGEEAKKKSSMDLATDSVHASHWVLRPETPLPDRPALRISWTPATMVFVPNGHMPFTLAVGRAGAAAAEFPLSKVVPGFTVEELLAAERAEIGVMKTQQEANGQSAGPLQASRNRVLVLWGVLLTGVALLALMAWKLAAQARRKGEQ